MSDAESSNEELEVLSLTNEDSDENMSSEENDKGLEGASDNEEEDSDLELESDDDSDLELETDEDEAEDNSENETVEKKIRKIRIKLRKRIVKLK